MSVPGRGLLAFPRATTRDLAVAVSCGLAAGGLVVAQAILLGRAIDDVFLQGQGVAAIVPAAGGIVLAAAARALLAWAGDVLAQRAAGGARVALRDRLVGRLIDLGPAGIASESAGELSHTIVGGVEAFDAYVAQYLPQVVLAATLPFVILAVVALIDPLSALVLAITGPLIPLFMVLIGGAARERTRRQWTTLSRLSARFLDSIQGLATLKAFGREADEAAVIADASERFRRLTMGVLRVAFLSAFTLELLATIGVALVAVEVGLRLLYGRLEFREAFLALLLAPEFYRPLRALGASFHAGLAGREAAGRMGQLLGPAAAALTATVPGAAMPDARAARGSTSVAVPGPPAITFDHVGFTYPGTSRPSLDDVGFEIAAGETVALVGASGAGKTTIANILLRFIAPHPGRVLADGTPLETIDADAWRAHVAWVPQRPHLFHGSLRDNLLMARPAATDAELDRAVRLAHADEFIGQLARGLDTPVGERGARLSAGQAQRLALARAFLRDAPILVLDEPTANLDPDLEAQVHDAVTTLRRDRTVLLVAHRLTTVADADTIVVMAGGRVVEQGTHAGLLTQRGLYARMVAAFGGEA